MNDMLIRNIDPELKRRLEERARTHNRSLSEEAKALMQRGLDAPETGPNEMGMGTWLRSLIPAEAWVDLEEPQRDIGGPPPDFS